MPEAVVFLLRAVVLVLLWGFVIATVVAVRHDVFTERAHRITPPAPRPTPAPPPPPPPPPPAASEPPRATRRAGRQTRASGQAPATRVAVIDGPLAGTIVALSSLPITIGRAGDSTIVLADDYVSNHHARLVPQGAQWLVEDTGSTNGTYLGDKLLTAPSVVPVGGRIKIGRTVLELQA